MKQKLQQQFNSFKNENLFVVEMEKNELFNLYLEQFPEDERQYYNCHACRNFLNNYGNIVAIKQQGNNYSIVTLWDNWTLPEPYHNIPTKLSAHVKSKNISAPFINSFPKLGTDFNHERTATEIIRHDHFFIELPSKHIQRTTQVNPTINDISTNQQVFERALETITIDATATILDLIKDNTLYRGQEFKKQLELFFKHQHNYNKLTEKQKKLFSWFHRDPTNRIRNSAIGTLLIDLSEDMDIKQAVTKFERVVAPANYRRPQSLITPAMIKNAQQTLEELGLTNSLKRRHADLTDIPVTNALFVNRNKTTVNSVFDELTQQTPTPKDKFKKAQTVTLDDFIKNILPTANKIEMLVDQPDKFMSLIAAEFPDSPNLLAWDNQISWTYHNNQTDTIKQKVKQAGGTIESHLRCSLEWFNYDDLDLHLQEPSGNTIYFSSKRSPITQGTLDVDMNAGSGSSRTPVENIYYPSKNLIPEGHYKLKVNNFCKRESIETGFNVQIQCADTTYDLSYNKPVRDNETIIVAEFDYDKKTQSITNFKSNLDTNRSQKDTNKILTNTFENVNLICWSPNHWTNEIGNKHIFFILENAEITDPNLTIRPFFNEFLKPELNKHRKVFEILADKMKIPNQTPQTTGLGFSLTQPFSITLRINNNKVININSI